MLLIVNLVDVNSKFLYNLGKEVDFNVTLALLQSYTASSLKEALRCKEDFTFCNNVDTSTDDRSFVDLRQLEKSINNERLAQVLSSGNYSWKLTKLTDLYENIVDTDMQVDEDVRTYYRLESLRQSQQLA